MVVMATKSTSQSSPSVEEKRTSMLPLATNEASSAVPAKERVLNSL